MGRQIMILVTTMGTAEGADKGQRKENVADACDEDA